MSRSSRPQKHPLNDPVETRPIIYLKVEVLMMAIKLRRLVYTIQLRYQSSPDTHKNERLVDEMINEIRHVNPLHVDYFQHQKQRIQKSIEIWDKFTEKKEQNPVEEVKVKVKKSKQMASEKEVKKAKTMSTTTSTTKKTKQKASEKKVKKVKKAKTMSTKTKKKKKKSKQKVSDKKESKKEKEARHLRVGLLKELKTLIRLVEKGADHVEKNTNKRWISDNVTAVKNKTRCPVTGLYQHLITGLFRKWTLAHQNLARLSRENYMSHAGEGIKEIHQVIKDLSHLSVISHGSNYKLSTPLYFSIEGRFIHVPVSGIYSGIRLGLVPDVPDQYMRIALPHWRKGDFRCPPTCLDLQGNAFNKFSKWLGNESGKTNFIRWRKYVDIDKIKHDVALNDCIASIEQYNKWKMGDAECPEEFNCKGLKYMDDGDLHGHYYNQKDVVPVHINADLSLNTRTAAIYFDDKTLFLKNGVKCKEIDFVFMEDVIIIVKVDLIYGDPIRYPALYAHSMLAGTDRDEYMLNV